jgi:probable rRNA maturation factor
VDPDSKRVRVTVTDGAGRPVRDGGLARWVASIAPARARGDVSIALVSDARIRALNRQYRRKNQTTDVLSFPGSEPDLTGASVRAARSRRPGGSTPRPLSRAPRPVLGDIVIATGVARRQAKEAGHSLQAELRVLALHGLLHLLGYDHHDRNDKGRMVRAESRLRRQGGLASGLIERAGA